MSEAFICDGIRTPIDATRSSGWLAITWLACDATQ